MPLLLFALSNSIADEIKVQPPAVGAYHWAYPDFGGHEDEVTRQRLDDFETLAGKKIAAAAFSNNWKGGIKFPHEDVQIITSYGAIPIIRMMPRSRFKANKRDPKYRLKRIIKGKYDLKLVRWAQAAKSKNTPLIVDFAVEMNGNWFPWSGRLNGKGRKKRYGDKTLADGPEKYRDAYRHIIDLFREQGVENITWVFHVDAHNFPRRKWNKMKSYYPGDAYIDWIGVSVYGAQTHDEDWQTFSELFEEFYDEFSSISDNKPLAVMEFGVIDEKSIGSKSKWISDALQLVQQTKYNRIKAISYWHENWENRDGSISNLRLDSSAESLAAYQNGIDDSYFISQIIQSGNQNN